jgi:hypothetical protein
MNRVLLSPIDELLCAWHKHSARWSPCVEHGTSAMFAGVPSSRQHETEADLADAAISQADLKAVDFHVSEMSALFQAALYGCARSLAHGNSVWSNPRLPKDPVERGQLLVAAKVELIARLEFKS